MSVSMSHDAGAELGKPAPDGASPEVPSNFAGYIRGLGPGFVVVLTWLGAGDIISAGVAGSNYAYALMWAMVLAILMRYFFVSMIARYQLCNPSGEGVLDGLVRLNRFYGPFLFVVALLWGHLSCTFMVAGIGEVSIELFGVGAKWMWELFWVGLAALLVFRPIYGRIEGIFKVFVALMAASLLGCAMWVGFNPAGVLKGVFLLEVPAQEGPFGAMIVAMGMVGAVGGSLMNLVYPYFIDAKGWKGPKYRRVQEFDFRLAVGTMVIFNLAVWTLGAELVHATGRRIESLNDLTLLLSAILGNGGRVLFLCGVFAAIYTSILGHGLGLALMASHAWQRWHAGAGTPIASDYKAHPMYRWVALGIVVSPLVWMGRVEFVALTILANTASVLMIPALAGGLWWITASRRYIGEEHRNRWWENVIMATLFGIAIYSTWEAAGALFSRLH